MKNITITLYEYSELSAEAQKKVLTDLADINVFFDWWDSTYEDAERIGLKITGFGLDENKHCKGEFALPAKVVAERILIEHGEVCNTYAAAERFLAGQDHIGNGIEEDIFLNELLRAYANILQEESIYLLGEEAVIATIEANDYWFMEDGTEFKN